MIETIRILAVLSGVLRTAALVAFCLVAVAMVAEWAVRTRRVSPFGALSRFVRRYIDPRLRPVEARLVRAGMSPSNAPWAVLLLVAIVSILVIYLVDAVIGALAQTHLARSGGPRAMIALVVGWAFALLRIALIVRVISSWIQLGPHSRWVRWSYRLTDWLVRPLQRHIPTLGAVDLSPLVAYLALILGEALVLGLLRG